MNSIKPMMFDVYIYSHAKRLEIIVSLMKRCCKKGLIFCNYSARMLEEIKKDMEISIIELAPRENSGRLLT